MARSTQDKWDQALEDFRLTQNAINEMTADSHKLYGDYAYAAGYLQSMMAEVISKLPRADRELYRSRLLRQAQDHKNAILANALIGSP
jgi:hypothetical protein